MMHDFRNSPERTVEDLKKKKEVEENESKAKKESCKRIKEPNLKNKTDQRKKWAVTRCRYQN